ncbi:unnamed protein product, partial [marine sediment metagenome]
FSKNTYLFQSKNTKRFQEFQNLFPRHTYLGTTIETNRDNIISKAPQIIERIDHLSLFSDKHKLMVSVEPILDFDVNIMVNYLNIIHPDFVSIGADSKGHNLPEPSPEKIKELIKELKKFTEVKLKPNLKRLYS